MLNSALLRLHPQGTHKCAPTTAYFRHEVFHARSALVGHGPFPNGGRRWRSNRDPLLASGGSGRLRRERSQGGCRSAWDVKRVAVIAARLWDGQAFACRVERLPLAGCRRSTPLRPDTAPNERGKSCCWREWAANALIRPAWARPDRRECGECAAGEPLPTVGGRLAIEK